jgi:hypothetical protein
MTLPLVLRANSELVALAYIRDMVTAYDVAVGAVLQGPNSDGVLTWGDTGFVQCGNLGGAVNPNVPLRTPVVSLDVWAVQVGSKRAPWGRAYAIAETIVAATYDTGVIDAYDTHRVVTLPTGYPSARVTAFYATTEPSRRPSDQSDYAHVGFDVAIAWHGLDNQ